VPKFPSSIENPIDNKVILTKKSYPIAEGLKPLFPTLLAQEMSYVEWKKDPTGMSLQGKNPLNVRF